MTRDPVRQRLQRPQKASSPRIEFQTASGLKVGLAFLVSQLGYRAAQVFAARLGPIGLTPQHVGVLRLLAARPAKLTQKALVERLGVVPSRLVALLDELAEQGLVERCPNPDDRRSNLLHITRGGPARFAEVERITAELEAGSWRRRTACSRECIPITETVVPSLHPLKE